MKSNSFSKRRSLTTSEIISLFVLFVVGVTYLSAKHMIIPKFNEYKAASNNLKNAEIRCAALEKEYKNLNKYKEEEKNLKYKLNMLVKQLPPYVSQEDIIITVDRYAKENKLDIKTLALDNEKSASADNVINNKDKGMDQVFNGSAEEKKADTTAEEKDTDTVDKEKKEEVNSKTKAQSPMVLTKYVDVSFKGGVSALYNFIDDLEQNVHKLFVRELSINGSTDGLLMGNMKIQYIGYKNNSGEEADFHLDIPAIDGKSNPFEPYEGYLGDGSQYSSKDSIPIKGYEPNFYLKLNQYNVDGPKYIMSEYKRMETEIYSNLNQAITGKIKIAKDGDKFNYTYELGNTNKNELKGIKFSDGVIRLEVNSRKRISTEDKMNIVLDIENNTELLFEIILVNDDNDKPLFKLGNKVGKVDLKRVIR